MFVCLDTAASPHAASTPQSSPGAPKEFIDSVLAAAAFIRRMQSLQQPVSQRLGGSMASAPSNAIISSLLNSAQSKVRYPIPTH